MRSATPNKLLPEKLYTVDRMTSSDQVAIKQIIAYAICELQKIDLVWFTKQTKLLWNMTPLRSLAV